MNITLEVGTIAALIFSTIGSIILFISNRKIAYKNIEIQEKNQNISNKISSTNSKLQSLDNQRERINTYISENRVKWMQLLKQYITEYLGEVDKYSTINAELFNEYIKGIKLKTTQIKLHLNYLGKADQNILKEIYYLNRILELKHMEDKIKNIYSHGDDVNIEDEKEIQDTIILLRNLEYYYTLYDRNALRSNDEIWEQLLNNEGECRDDIQEIYLKEISNFYQVLMLKPQLIVIYTEVYLKTEWERVKSEIENGNYKNYNFDCKYNENIMKVEKNISDIEEFIEKDIEFVCNE